MPAGYTVTAPVATVLARLTQDALDALLPAGDFIIEEANRVIPFDDGDLADSGHTVLTEHEGLPTAVVIYDMPYAAAQEFRDDYQHAPGRKAHFLADTVTDNEDRIAAFLATRLKGH